MSITDLESATLLRRHQQLFQQVERAFNLLNIDVVVASTETLFSALIERIDRAGRM